ncbi:DNA cytosine methyltransferase [Pseudomonas sp. NBRC 111127]|uniref:DNA cytosine methyltransferase n=1 Tax=Pseudomonas sp. NBRC 111127 TaxID=1661042 RepID=UPI0006D460E4|nr:DNA cytosine methyltransferase [Pseudomonas sp. NBRC 111127]
MPITYGSVCSGIEAATVAWHPLGWRAAWYAEIEPFPSAVLAHHYPDTPNHGDMTRLAAMVLSGKIQAPDALVGGTPCQAFSVAGMREGLADPRGALTIKYVELLDAIDHVRTKRGEPEAACVWENVPGVLSDKGNAFGCFLGALVGESAELKPPGGKWKDAGCVYGPTRTVAWRVLDAQYFGLAQRRRRVFVVASARAGFDPLEVLFEREGVRRDTPPRRGEGQAPAGTITASTGGVDENDAADGRLTVYGGNNTAGPIDVAPARNACASASGRMDFETEAFVVSGTLQANGKAAGSATQQDAESGMLVVHGTQDPCTLTDQAFALGRNSGQENAVCVTGEITHTLKAEGFDASEDGTGRGQPIVSCRELAQTLTSSYGKQVDSTDSAKGPNVVVHSESVRRLTPRECERLQGFPDDYTLIPYRTKPASDCPDGPRYKAIGNSKAVPVVRWIGRRIQHQLERLA